MLALRIEGVLEALGERCSENADLSIAAQSGVEAKSDQSQCLPKVWGADNRP